MQAILNIQRLIKIVSSELTDEILVENRERVYDIKNLKKIKVKKHELEHNW